MSISPTTSHNTSPSVSCSSEIPSRLSCLCTRITEWFANCHNPFNAPYVSAEERYPLIGSLYNMHVGSDPEAVNHYYNSYMAPVREYYYAPFGFLAPACYIQQAPKKMRLEEGG